jgi:hypothetical protein
VAAQPAGGISLDADGVDLGDSKATVGVDSFAINPGGISTTSEPVSTNVSSRLRRTHHDFEVMGAAEVGKEFLIAVHVKAGARGFIRRTADDAGLRALPGLFLVSIEVGSGLASYLYI